MNPFEPLRQDGVVDADTGHLHELARVAPRDASTNPCLILRAVRQSDDAPRLSDLAALHREPAHGIRSLAADLVRPDRLIQGLQT